MEAVRLAQSIGIPEAVKRLGVSDSALRKWDNQYKQGGDAAFNQPSGSDGELQELRRLREENRQLKMERDILK